MKRSLIYFLICLSALLVCSCESYRGRFIGTGYPFGDGIWVISDSIPVDAGGLYRVHYTGNVQDGLSFETLKEKLYLEKQEGIVNAVIDLPVLTDSELSLMSFPFEGKLNIDDGGSAKLEYGFPSASQEGLVRLDSISFNPVSVRLTGAVSCTSVSDFPALDTKTVMVLPSRYRISDSRVSGHVLTSTGSLSSSGVFDYESVNVSMTDFSDSPTVFEYSDDFLLTMFAVIIPDVQTYKALMGKKLSASITLSREGPDGGAATPGYLFGIVDKTGGQTRRNLAMTGFSKQVKDFFLDLGSSSMNLDITTNATSPVKVAAGLAPYFGQEPGTAADSSFISSYVSDPTGTVTSHHVFSDGSFHLDELPDSIVVTLSPSTFIDETHPEVSNKTALISDTDVRTDYDFVIPLDFDNDIPVVFKHHISDVSSGIISAISTSGITITGEVIGEFPADLVFTAEFLDENQNLLGISSSESTVPASAGGVSSYSIDVMSSGAAESVSSFNLVIRMKMEQNTHLEKDDYVSFSIRVFGK